MTYTVKDVFLLLTDRQKERIHNTLKDYVILTRISSEGIDKVEITFTSVKSKVRKVIRDKSIHSNLSVEVMPKHVAIKFLNGHIDL
jgi:hypothetical protein